MTAANLILAINSGVHQSSSPPKAKGALAIGHTSIPSTSQVTGWYASLPLLLSNGAPPVVW
jgi:hypothetical protein